MTGPEHYREAERLITESTRAAERSTNDAALAGLAVCLQMAQVHATLALVAAVESAEVVRA